MNPASEREVCLRPEYAAVYPGLRPGEWVPASKWAAAIVARAQEARLLGTYQRTFDSRHFQFRGGQVQRPPGDRHLRSRVEDR
jgi:hypothetical protein